MANKVIVAVTRIKMDGNVFEPGNTLDFSGIDRTMAKARIQELYDVGAIRIATVESEPTAESEAKPTPKQTPTTTTSGPVGSTTQTPMTGTSGPVSSDVKSDNK